ncbi:hypothetical protein FGO68_gene9168 [Halteria grandinella]|uniref:Uncharacterized protein n=1 Tax=Halteria grandinella TaxID=5974 RepID=A0A8J8NTK2_HALGN|nr:hypothetical protein FGO68_gene9168 [Halteria grandinella]
MYAQFSDLYGYPISQQKLGGTNMIEEWEQEILELESIPGLSQSDKLCLRNITLKYGPIALVIMLRLHNLKQSFQGEANQLFNQLCCQDDTDFLTFMTAFLYKNYLYESEEPFLQISADSIQYLIIESFTYSAQFRLAFQRIIPSTSNLRKYYKAIKASKSLTFRIACFFKIILRIQYQLKKNYYETHPRSNEIHIHLDYKKVRVLRNLNSKLFKQIKEQHMFEQYITLQNEMLGKFEELEDPKSSVCLDALLNDMVKDEKLNEIGIKEVELSTSLVVGTKRCSYIM